MNSGNGGTQQQPNAMAQYQQYQAQPAPMMGIGNQYNPAANPAVPAGTGGIKAAPGQTPPWASPAAPAPWTGQAQPGNTGIVPPGTPRMPMTGAPGAPGTPGGSIMDRIRAMSGQPGGNGPGGGLFGQGGPNDRATQEANRPMSTSRNGGMQGPVGLQNPNNGQAFNAMNDQRIQSLLSSTTNWGNGQSASDPIAQLMSYGVTPQQLAGNPQALAAAKASAQWQLQQAQAAATAGKTRDWGTPLDPTKSVDTGIFDRGLAQTQQQLAPWLQ